MDKSWITRSRMSAAYRKGVEDFLNFAILNTPIVNMVRCPCKKCQNRFYHTREIVRTHLVLEGIEPTYTEWTYHGEDVATNTTMGTQTHDPTDDMQDLLNDIFAGDDSNEAVDLDSEGFESPNTDATKFYTILRDAEKELYPGCKSFSKLSFIVKLLHIKSLNGWSNKSFTMLLELLSEALPDDHVLPTSHYEAMKVVGELGLDYVRIDACPNNCILFRKKHEKADTCHICNASRWDPSFSNKRKKGRKNKRVPAKVLHYFPLIPRLQRLFMSVKTSEHMTWHHNHRIADDLMRHPRDSMIWKSFDQMYATFSSDPRNVRLGLASDGMNPYGNMNNPHSTWPVVVIPYNMPPWICMKQQNFILSMIIPGPRSPPNIDVFLEPLVDELKILWDTGVETYDAYKRQNFQMRAALMWTINDFPAYANLSGWSTKGYLACPVCANHTPSRMQQVARGKICYIGHRRWLPPNHHFRRQKSHFDGKDEKRSAPVPLSGVDILGQLDYLMTNHWNDKQSTQNDVLFGKLHNWKKKSIFFELPYWASLPLRHNLDVMHTEKNICETLLWTIMDVAGKSKDNIKSRLDLQAMQIRRSLHPELVNNEYRVPVASYTLSNQGKEQLCSFLKNLKVPDGYSSNIKRCVIDKRRIMGLKSHDCHLLLEYFLPIALRTLMNKEISSPIIELCHFFRDLCSKVIRVEDLEKLQMQVQVTLCKLEKIFPPSFFVIMMHLPIHLAYEAKIAGPVQYRWMYPIERYLRTLKCYVRNKARPEGSIAQGYLASECLTFCSRYLNGVETRFNRCERNEAHINRTEGRTLGKPSVRALSDAEYLKVRQYILENTNEVNTFIEEHKSELQHAGMRDIERVHRATFVPWFERRVEDLNDQQSPLLTPHLKALAYGPTKHVLTYGGFLINGFRFHSEEVESRRKTQNSGVVTKGLAVDWYGVLQEIIKIDYGQFNIVVFKCKWYDVYRKGIGYKVDTNGYKCFNTTRLIYQDDPFILSNQANQFFYIDNTDNANWKTVLPVLPRNFYEMPIDSEETNVQHEEAYQQSECQLNFLNHQDDLHDIEPIWHYEVEPSNVISMDAANTEADT